MPPVGFSTRDSTSENSGSIALLSAGNSSWANLRFGQLRSRCSRLATIRGTKIAVTIHLQRISPLADATRIPHSSRRECQRQVIQKRSDFLRQVLLVFTARVSAMLRDRHMPVDGRARGFWQWATFCAAKHKTVQVIIALIIARSWRVVMQVLRSIRLLTTVQKLALETHVSRPSPRVPRRHRKALHELWTFSVALSGHSI
jgi:hypothetical protein